MFGFEAAVDGSTVGTPVVFAVLTTMVAFGPLGYWCPALSERFWGDPISGHCNSLALPLVGPLSPRAPGP